MGAGKTSAAKYLTGTHGFQYLRYSQILAEWLANDCQSKADLQEIGWKVMAGGMQPELNRRLIVQILPEVDVAVDGLRHTVDYETLRNSFSDSFRLLYIDSPVKCRWERLRIRGTYTEFRLFEAADSHPVERSIESLRGCATLIIRNEGPLENLYAMLGEAIRGFRRESHP
jgi:dephospho-CoA kinase